VKDLVILIPSWRGPSLLATTLDAIKKSCVTDYDVLPVLNEPSDLDIEVCKSRGIEFLFSDVNLGTLAVDLAIPRISGKYKYIANANNDMLLCPSWDKTLIEYYEKNDCLSVSSPAVEYNGGANGLDTINDPKLPAFIDPACYENFSKNFLNGKYLFPNIISQRHPIIHNLEEWIECGAYSNGSQNYFPGYTLDFAHPCRMMLKYGESRPMVSVGDAPVFHDYSSTMKKLPVNLQQRHCQDVFLREFGFTVTDFKRKIGFNNILE
jgi:hypothetical protein